MVTFLENEELNQSIIRHSQKVFNYNSLVIEFNGKLIFYVGLSDYEAGKKLDIYLLVFLH